MPKKSRLTAPKRKEGALKKPREISRPSVGSHSQTSGDVSTTTMVKNTIQWTNEHRFIILAFIGVIVVVILVNLNGSLREELQSVSVNNEMLVEEVKQLEEKIRQLQNDSNVCAKENSLLTEELQSVKGENEKLLDEVKGLKDEVKKLKTDGNLCTEKINQLMERLQSANSENLNLMDKVKLLESEARQLHDDHEVWVEQVVFMERWMRSIGKLEDHIEAVIHYSKLKKGESEFYSLPDNERNEMSQLRSRIGYDIDINYVDEIILKAIDLIVKFKHESDKFLIALRSMNIERMKSLQVNTNMDRIREKMEEFVTEVSGFKSHRSTESRFVSQKSAESRIKLPQSTETAVQRNGMLSNIYRFGEWVVQTIWRWFSS